MTYTLTGLVACEDGCCVVGRDDELREELLGWDGYPGNHVRPMFECYTDSADENDFWESDDDAASWDPFAHHDGVCSDIRDTDGNQVFPWLCDPRDQHCPYPKPLPPPPPRKDDRRFALAA